jgi:uncharacterized protein (DUF342 family)
MMLKNISRLECEIADKKYQFTCDMDSPLENVKEALFQFQQYCLAIDEQVKLQKEAAEKAKSEAPIEVEDGNKQ